MKYDFTTIMDRHNKDALAVDGLGLNPGFTPDRPKDGFDVIPMWVADMNFPTVPTITEAIIERAKHPAFGYFRPTKEYYQSIINWHKNRNGVTDLKAEYIGYENGVLGGVVSAANILCSKGDNILVNAPTYIGFTNALAKKNGYNLVASKLIKDENNIWRMDYEDMERKIVENNIHTAIICSPYNPAGRVWEREELEKIIAIYEKHNVYIISDEIWSDLILEGHKHIPTQQVNDYAKYHTIAFYAPSKTFNLAGLVGSYRIVYDTWLRERLLRESATSCYNDMNVLSMHALIGAYKQEGYEWLDELRQVLTANVQYAYQHIKDHYEGIDVSMPEGTYMLFLNCQEYLEKHHMTLEELEKKGWDVGVAWQDGKMFGDPYGIRMNFALPLSRIQEAFKRLDTYVFCE
ncbi:MAG TPA: aspartate aminotransferase [Erysipelotrichaceae bacterium]|nr:aspartate aminotransferase [Erysipelotrichaceae bacterium]HCJ37759.1 aspartate aminotransferase [Erysipelotrichaceae bacterium]